MIKVDPFSWIPEDIRKKILDGVVDFIANQAGKVLNKSMSENILKLKSDSGFQNAFDEGIERAINRFLHEYIQIDEDLTLAITNEKEFWQSKSVKLALIKSIEHPRYLQAENQEIFGQHFDDVLPQRINRKRVDQAMTFFLDCLSEELWHLPQLKPIYELQFEKITAQKTTEMVAEIQGMRADFRADKKTLPDTSISTEVISKKILHNLPNPDYISFIGRQEELHLIHNVLLPTNRAWIIEIDGIGGVGKSALALEIGHRVLSTHNEAPEKEKFSAVIWVSAKLATLTANGIVTRPQAIRALEDIYRTIAVTLEREDITRVSLEEQNDLIRQALTQRRSLLIVDNLETIDDEKVITFLRELPAPTKCIVTTREKMDLAFSIRLTGMPKNDGLNLVNQECNKKGITLSDSEKEKLYNRTGGVPLAIAWSIAQMGYSSSIDAVLHRLGEPYEDISKFCFIGVVDKIRGTDSFKLLLALSLFSTDANLDALSYVAGLGKDLLSTDEGLTHLEKLSLVNKKEKRFNLLPLTREYAKVELEANPILWEEYLERYIKYYIDLVNEFSRSDFSSHKVFDKELTNILYLMSFCHAKGQDEVIAKIMKGFDIYLRTRGYWNETLENLKITLKQAIKQNDTLGQSHANRGIGRIYLYRREYENAKRHLVDAYEQSNSINSIRDTLSAASYLSLVYADTNNIAAARKLLVDSLQMAISSKEYELIIRLQNQLAEIDIEEENLTKAHERIRSVLGIEDASSFTSTVALGRTYLIAGTLELRENNFKEATKHFERSLNIASDRGIEQDIGNAILWIAKLLQEENKYEEALLKAQESYAIFSRIGDYRGAIDSQGLVYELSGGWKTAMYKSFTQVE